MTAGERLKALAGASGTAAALLLVIGTGATSGAALQDYSQLPTGTAAQHLLVDPVIPPTPGPTEPITGVIRGGGGASNGEPKVIYDWRSVDALYRQESAAKLAIGQNDDDIIMAVIMTAITEDLI